MPTLPHRPTAKASSTSAGGKKTRDETPNPKSRGGSIKDDDIPSDDEKQSTETDLKEEFKEMLRDIKRGDLVTEQRTSTILGRLNQKCDWLPLALVEGIPRKRNNFENFCPLLDKLFNHPHCGKFPLWTIGRQEDKDTILHEAAYIGHRFLILHIIENFREGEKALHQRNSNGRTCLHFASQRVPPDPILVELLLKLGGDSSATVRDVHGNTPLHLAADAQRCQDPAQKEVVEILLKASREMVGQKNDNKYSPLRYYHETRKLPGFAPEADGEVAKSIEDLLMLNCLRLDIGRKETWEILYDGPADRREFVFDLYGYDEIKADHLENLSGHLCLETMLKTVTIPDLSVHPPEGYEPRAGRMSMFALGNIDGTATAGSTVIPARAPGRWDGCDELSTFSGRIDFCWIFQWLRYHEVSWILGVSVEDQREASHSDQAIEWCLKGMKVEVLNWNRLDICSTTIAAAAPGVRELTLWCSGNNAVLKSWTSAGGLPELENLKVLRLKILQGLDSLDRSTKQIELFESKLQRERQRWCEEQHAEEEAIEMEASDGEENEENANEEKPSDQRITCPKHEIMVYYDIVGSDGRIIKSSKSNVEEKKPDTEAEKETGVERQVQEWIRCMEKFSEFIHRYRRKAEEGVDPAAAPPRIKVALIDDGVDGLAGDMKDVILAGETFSERSKHDFNSYFKSTRGHGTIMAMLIRKMCPCVQLYVAKLNEEKTWRNTMSITAESAVDAVRWAMSQDVDIISISWTISKTNDPTAIINLTHEINEAVKKGILIFCSVSDQITEDKNLAPASLNESLFRIGTATLSGQAWRWNGANDVHYILPGTDLEVEVGEELFDDRLQHICESGSSLATALAAGLAALILDCIALDSPSKLKLMRMPGERAYAKMNMVLEAISNSDHKPHDKRYLRVWDTFGQALDNEGKEDKEKLESLVNELMGTVQKDEKYKRAKG